MISDLLIVVGGLLTTLLTIAFAFFIRRWQAVITWLAGGFIPIGAVLLGILSASGFWATARATQRRMSLTSAILMMGILIPAYFGHYFVLYKTMSVQLDTGEVVPIERVTNFWSYYQWELTTRSYKWNTGPSRDNPRPVGRMGYLYGGLELLGFLLGGFTILRNLRRIPYCGQCERYFDSVAVGKTTSRVLVSTIKQALGQGDEVALLREVKEWPQRLGMAEWFNREVCRLRLYYCANCQQNPIVDLEKGSGYKIYKPIACRKTVSPATAQHLLLHAHKPV